jgi:CCR4-NOT transcription complex subunit 1
LIGLYRGLQNTQFPIELLYRHWTNSDAQLAWFTHALKNPDIFCFADFSCDRADMALLKSVPEDYRQKDIQLWLCLDLLETLLFLADGGFSQEVLSLMEAPLFRCPDVLLLSLLQLSPNSMQLVTSRTRQQLVRLCVQKFLCTHPNSQAVLHYAWTIYPNNKLWAQQLMVDAMADWYISGRYDQSRLARILDVAQDLKALADLLQCDILPFVIDLACLAARREYLKLDKWMQDKMTEHGMNFVEACLRFLERRCPTLVSGK